MKIRKLLKIYLYLTKKRLNGHRIIRPETSNSAEIRSKSRSSIGSNKIAPVTETRRNSGATGSQISHLSATSETVQRKENRKWFGRDFSRGFTKFFGFDTTVESVLDQTIVTDE